MGANGSRVIQIDDLSDRLNECVKLKDQYSQIYGEVRYVSFQGMPFYLCQSQTQSLPHTMSLHYLVKPNILLFPKFTLLQHIRPNDFFQLLQIIKGISQMAIQGGIVGFGYNRIGYNARWGVVGQKDIYWPYYQVIIQNNSEGVFLSPQLMIAFSQQKQNPKVDFQKSDIFSFGIMLIQRICNQNLDIIYDFQNFQIFLNPLLEKILRIKNEFGEQFANILVSMLQIQQKNRINFLELLQSIEELKIKYSRNMIRSNNNQNFYQYQEQKQRNSIKKNIYSSKSPKKNKQNYRNDVSPFRGRFGNNVRQSQSSRKNKTPQRMNRSPLRNDGKFNKQNQESNYKVNFPIYRNSSKLSSLARK